MSYLVLARKWRPQRFCDVIGQSHVTKTLLNAMRFNRLAHAFLFTGPRGVGKTSTARILAKVLRCLNPVDGEPCNECISCKEITDGRAIDVQEIDGASNNGVDAIRDLRENITYLPTSGKYKIYIIDEVHMLTGSAFNAFLKTLEEPPPHVYFIFATTEPHKIPITIHSRCQIYDFKRVPTKQIVELLTKITSEEHITASPRGLGLIARESEGCLRDALSLLDQVYAYSGDDITDQAVSDVIGAVDARFPIEILRAVLKKDSRAAIDIMHKIYEAGYDLHQVMSSLLSVCRNLSVILAVPEYEFEDLTDAEQQELRMLSTESNAMQVQEWFRYLMLSQGELSRARFPRQVFEMTILRLLTIEPTVSIDEWVSRLEELGGRFAEEKMVKQTISATTSGAATVRSPVPSKDKWIDLLQAIKSKKPLIGTMLEEGFLVSLSSNEIVVGYEEGSFCSRQLSDTDHKKNFEKIASEHFNSSMKLKVVSLSSRDLESKDFISVSGKKPEQKVAVKSNSGESDGFLEEAKRIFRGEFIT